MHIMIARHQHAVSQTPDDDSDRPPLPRREPGRTLPPHRLSPAGALHDLLLRMVAEGDIRAAARATRGAVQ